MTYAGHFQTGSVNVDYIDTVDNVLTPEQPKGSPSARGRWPYVGKLGSIDTRLGGSCVLSPDQREAVVSLLSGRARVLERRNGSMKTFINMLRDDSGASAAEYALILAIIGGAIAVAAVLLGGAIAGAMNKAKTCINAGSKATTALCP